VTIAPITSAIIAAVEAGAHADKMDKIHFESKHGIILFDSSQIAGVDYNEDALQNEDHPYQEEFQADTDEEEESDSDYNTEASAITEASTKTQEPVVLTQEEEPQPQVLTQAQENPIRDEST